MTQNTDAPSSSRARAMPDWMAAWGEADPAAEYAAAAAAGPRALDRLLTRRLQREDRYWRPIREVEAREHDAAQIVAIEEARLAHATDMREYRAKVKAERLALLSKRP